MSGKKKKNIKPVPTYLPNGEVIYRYPDSLEADDSKLLKKTADKFRTSVPESWRTVMPGVSDIEDVIFLKDAIQTGDIKNIGIGAAGFMLPVVGSKAIKGLGRLKKSKIPFNYNPTLKTSSTLALPIAAKDKLKSIDNISDEYFRVVDDKRLTPEQFDFASNKGNLISPDSKPSNVVSRDAKNFIEAPYLGATSSRKQGMSTADAFLESSNKRAEKTGLQTAYGKYKIKDNAKIVTYEDAANYLNEVSPNRGYNLTQSEVEDILFGSGKEKRLADSERRVRTNAQNLRKAGVHGVYDPDKDDYQIFPEVLEFVEGSKRIRTKDGNFKSVPMFKNGGQIMNNSTYKYGGYFLPEYGFGSWLKDNSAGMLKTAGALSAFLPPPISMIAGPALSIAGAAVQGAQDKKLAEADSREQARAQEEQLAMEQKQLDAQQLAQEEQAYQSDLSQRRSAFGDRNRQVSYGTTFAEMGGQIGMGLMGQDPNIVEYSDKAFSHGEGPNGIPVDSRGNPSKVSKNSPVAVTEAGEVSWNGYVFSNKLKLK